MEEATLIQANRMLGKINAKEKAIAFLDYPRLILVAVSQSGQHREEIEMSEALREKVRAMVKDATATQLANQKADFVKL